MYFGTAQNKPCDVQHVTAGCKIQQSHVLQQYSQIGKATAFDAVYFWFDPRYCYCVIQLKSVKRATVGRVVGWNPAITHVIG